MAYWGKTCMIPSDREKLKVHRIELLCHLLSLSELEEYTRNTI